MLISSCLLSGGWMGAMGTWGTGVGYLDQGSGQVEVVKALKVTEQDIMKGKQIKLCQAIG